MYRGNITLRGKNKEIAIDGSKIILIMQALKTFKAKMRNKIKIFQKSNRPKITRKKFRTNMIHLNIYKSKI